MEGETAVLPDVRSSPRCWSKSACPKYEHRDDDSRGREGRKRLQNQPEAKIVTTMSAGAPRFFFAMAPELPDPLSARIVVLTTPDSHAREALKLRLRLPFQTGWFRSYVRVTSLCLVRIRRFRSSSASWAGSCAIVPDLRESLEIMKGVYRRPSGKRGLGQSYARASLVPRPGPAQSDWPFAG